MQWDEDDLATPTENLNAYQWNAPITTPARPPGVGVPQERTPLIRKANSFRVPALRRYDSTEGKKTKVRTKPPRKIRPPQPIQKAQEITAAETRYPLGRSTFGQTVSETRPSSYLICSLNICRIKAIQFDRYSTWHRDAVGAPRLCLRGLGLRHPTTHFLRVSNVPHVRVFVVGGPLEIGLG